MKAIRRVAWAMMLMIAWETGARAQGESESKMALPSGFVDARETVPGLVLELRYRTHYNFVGEPIDGYLAEKCVMTREAADALAKVQDELGMFGLGLKVFDAYRPQRAVDHFVRWAEDPDDTRMKGEFYPRVEKSELFEKGYIAARSGHTRGSTVDVTLVALEQAEVPVELDMGSPYDFFGPVSWPGYKDISGQARANRMLLRTVMVRHGFQPYDQEWWHFTLKKEPFPETYFDFPIY